MRYALHDHRSRDKPLRINDQIETAPRKGRPFGEELMRFVTDTRQFNHLVNELHRDRFENTRVNRFPGSRDPGNLCVGKALADLLCKTKLQDAVADDLLTGIDEDGFRAEGAYRQVYRRYV